MTNTNTTITAGMTLSTRSLCDNDCIFTVEVIDRKNTFATVRTDEGVKRCKVMEYDGREYIMPFGRYSMAPAFYAA